MNRRYALLTMTCGVLCGFVASAQSPTPAQATQAPAAPVSGRGGGRGGPTVVSPQIETDGRVTFRVVAPNATTITVAGDINGSLVPDPGAPASQPPAAAGTASGRGGGPPAVAMSKGENGVWIGTTVRPVKPG